MNLEFVAAHDIRVFLQETNNLICLLGKDFQLQIKFKMCDKLKYVGRLCLKKTLTGNLDQKYFRCSVPDTLPVQRKVTVKADHFNRLRIIEMRHINL